MRRNSRFILRVCKKGELLNKSSLASLWAPVVLNNRRTAGFTTFENGYAIGWQVENRKQHRAVSSSGANANTMIYYPEDNLSIIVLTNLLGLYPFNL
jgi:CubicO group peptidase (beta-lactamase class C family)